MKYSYAGEEALILGGSSEIGLALAVALLEQGIRPVCSYRNNEGKQRILDLLQPYQNQYMIVYCDFSDSSSWPITFPSGVTRFDYLIDCAHTDFEGLLAAVHEDDVSRYYTENIAARAVILKQVTRMMLQKHRGRCVFISSTAALRQNPGQALYASAKCASETLYRSIGIELGSKGITTVSLRLGYVDAGRGRDYLLQRSEELKAKIPVKKFLSVTDVTAALMFLLSDNASSINATEIVMDGGFTAVK
jgi:3-oxoacyl-[acyl-carrier protein] reductase